MRTYKPHKEGYTYTKEDIDDYKDKITDSQAKELIEHCNKFNISPEICAWYDDMDDFYTDWVYDNNICEDESDADERYEYGCEIGEFKKFSNGEIVRLVY